jgi:hypothetical protein
MEVTAYLKFKMKFKEALFNKVKTREQQTQCAPCKLHKLREKCVGTHYYQGKRQNPIPKIEYEDAPNVCYNRIFNLEEQEYAISRLDNKKAPGADQIHVEFLKHIGPKAKHILFFYFYFPAKGRASDTSTLC